MTMRGSKSALPLIVSRLEGAPIENAFREVPSFFFSFRYFWGIRGCCNIDEKKEIVRLDRFT